MRVLAITAVLTMFCTQGLAQGTDRPFADLWRVKGVTVSDNGRGTSLRWPATAYQHQLPGYQVIEWEAGEDIRLKSEIVITCRVPDSSSVGEPLEAELRLPRHPDAQNSEEADEAFKEFLSAAEKGFPALFATAFAPEHIERTPVRVDLGGGAAFSSLLVQYPDRPSRASVVEPLEPEWMLSALVSGIETDMTVDGQEVQGAFRFKPDVGLARAARLMVQHCAERQHTLTEPSTP